MVNPQRYQSIVDGYLAQMEKSVQEFEDELARHTATLKDMARTRDRGGVEEEGETRKDHRLRRRGSDRRTARGPMIFDDD